MAGPLCIPLIAEGSCAIAEVEGLVERSADVVGAEPEGDVAEGGAVGVVEVMAGGEELDGAGSAVVEGIEQAGVQTLREEDLGGDTGLHHF